MGLESATYISDLNTAYPEGGDLQAQGDDHIRLVKAAIKATFPDGSKAFYFPKVSAEKTSNFSISLPGDDNTLFPVNATSAAVTVTLGSGGIAGQKVTIVKTDSSVNAVTISGTIMGSGSSLVLRHQGATAQLIWDHANTRWNALYTERLDVTPKYFSLTSNTTLTVLHDDAVIAADASSAGFTITLPTTNIPTGYRAKVIKTDSSTNIIVVGSVNLYNQNEWVEVVWNGSAYVYDFGLACSSADVWAGNVDRNLQSSDITAASAIQSLSFASPIAWSWTGGFTREVELTDDGVLDNPTGGIPGTFRTIIIKGSSSTERALTFGNQFGGELPTVTDITSTKWYAVTIMCRTSSHFIVVGIADASPP